MDAFSNTCAGLQKHRVLLLGEELVGNLPVAFGALAIRAGGRGWRFRARVFFDSLSD
jgi:hypothetical protein